MSKKDRWKKHDDYKPWDDDYVGWGKGRIYGTQGDDTLTGSAWKDKIYGLGGNDTIDGGAGDDKIYGGTGLDTFVFSGFFGNDKIEDAQSGEALVFQDLTTADLSFFSKKDDLYIVANDGSGRVEIEHYFRDMPDLTVNGESLADLLGAGAGSDIFGTDRSERLYGTFGDDFIDAAGGNDYVDAGAGDDEVHGGLGNDKLEGGSGNDLLFGEEGNDRLDGGDGDDQLAGGAGNDTIDGDRGIDTAVFSGDSADFLVWGRGSRLFVEDTNLADGNEGRDYVKEVEVLQFDDTTIDLTAVSSYELSGILAGGPMTAADLDALITSATV